MTIFDVVSTEEQSKDLLLLRDRNIDIKPQDLVNVRDNMEQAARQLAEQPGTTREQKKALGEYMAALQTPSPSAGDLIVQTNAVLSHFPNGETFDAATQTESQQNLVLMRDVVSADSGLDRSTSNRIGLGLQQVENKAMNFAGKIVGPLFGLAPTKPN